MTETVLSSHQTEEKADDETEKTGREDTSDVKVELPEDRDSSSDDEDSDGGKLRLWWEVLGAGRKLMTTPRGHQWC